MNNYSKLLMAMMAGAAAGVAVGILIAPDKGSKSRKKIAEQARKLADSVLSKADETMNEVKKTVKNNIG